MPQLAVLLLALHLEVRQRRQQHRIPVDEPLAAIDEALVVQFHEHLGDGARQIRIHREALARPIDRGAEPAHLRADGAAGMCLPLPHAYHEGLAPEAQAIGAFRFELALHHHLRRDARMIGAGLPQGPLAAHAVIARQHIHQRVLEGVPHVQRTRHVRRRNDDAVGRPTGVTRRKPAVRFPVCVDPPLDIGRRVDFLHYRPARWIRKSASSGEGRPVLPLCAPPT